MAIMGMAGKGQIFIAALPTLNARFTHAWARSALCCLFQAAV